MATPAWTAPPVLDARTWLQQLRGGQTRPQLFLCADRERWVLKFAGNPHGGATALVADYLGSALAWRLGVPVFECALVQVSEIALSTAPHEVQSWARPGIAFGSRYQVATANLPELNVIDVIALASPAQIARLVALDTWLEVLDRRKPDGMWNLLADNSSNPSHLVVIDYGLSLSEPLQPVTILAAAQEIRPQFPETFRACVSETDVEAACDEIFAISEGELRATVNSVPAEWGASDKTRQAILDYLMSRKPKLKPCLRRALQS